MSILKQDTIDGLKHYVFNLDTIGHVSVFVQGDLEKQRDGVVFMTIHDVGRSYLSWAKFVHQDHMAMIKKRCLFLHVVLPGQEPAAPDLPVEMKCYLPASGFVFPTMHQLGLNLVTVLDILRIKQIVILGDGAGANIATRFAIFHPTRVHGLVALNCCGRASLHRFMDMPSEVVRKRAERKLNALNVSLYAEAFKKRIEILSTINQKLKVDVLLLTGSKSKYLKDSQNIQKQMQKDLSSFIRMEGATNVLEDAPEKAADAILLFCQGIGLMPTVSRKASQLLVVEGTNSVNISTTEDMNKILEKKKRSMCDHDVPNADRFALSSS